MANMKDVRKYQHLAQVCLSEMTTYPENRFSGRGIVICGGGPKYFTCAWVCLRMLRHLGCNLPAEIWYLGQQEMSDEMLEIMTDDKTTCVDAYKVRETHPCRRLHGWELNPYSVIHSKFQEVFFIDADNVAIRNPEFLFDSAQYKETGAIFWPDYGRLARSRDIWQICKIQWRDEPEFESGQMFIDKKRCWEALQLAMHYNEHSDFYYQHIHGDKDTYHMAWRHLNLEYSMPEKKIHNLASCVMCQHAFDGQIIFQHRNLAKWNINVKKNPKIPGFKLEDKCFEFLKELEIKWDGKVHMPKPKTLKGRDLYNEIVTTEFYIYNRVGYDKRTLQFLADNTLGEGHARLEETWHILEKPDGELSLCINGRGRLTCELKYTKKMWTGRWDRYERMPVELIPMHGETQDGSLSKARTTLVQQKYIYLRVQHSKRMLELRKDGDIGLGSSSRESKWELHLINKRLELMVRDSDGNITCKLVEEKDGVWRGRLVTPDKTPIELIPIP